MKSPNIIIEIAETVDECNEGQSKTECAKEIIKDLVVHQLSEHSPWVDDLMTIWEAKEYVDQCRQNHDLSICTIGALTNVGSKIATEYMSKSLILATPISPCPIINATMGTMGMIKAKEIGKSFGDMTVAVVEYLVDHVPSQVIDVSKPLVLKNDQIQMAIEFVPNELKFIKGLVEINQIVNRDVLQIQSSSSHLIDDFNKYRNRTQSEAINFNQKTKEVEIKLDSNLKMVKKLQKLDLSNNALPKIKSDGLAEKIKYNYVEKMEQASSYNQNPNRTHNAEVSCDGDKWKIGFSISYSFGGSGQGGGGFSCVML